METQTVKKGKVLVFGPASSNDQAVTRFLLLFGWSDRLRGFLAGLGIDDEDLCAREMLWFVRDIRKG
jgi:hypothetical protein